MRRNGCEEKLGRKRGTGKWRKKERLDAICCEDERVKGKGKVRENDKEWKKEDKMLCACVCGGGACVCVQKIR